MRSKSLTIWVVLVVLVVTGSTRADFVLYGNEQRTVNSYHSEGYLYDTSCVFIVSGGAVVSLNTNDSSTANISGGTIHTLLHYGNSTANISGGTITGIQSYGTVNISGGAITGNLYTDNFSTVNISGGTINGYLYARDSGIANIFGQNFHYGSGLTLNGNRVLGTGILSGEWLNGTPWAMNIQENYSTATILAVPEPATLLLLGLGVPILSGLRRKR